jgi:Ubiquitin-conjugating enzyme
MSIVRFRRLSADHGKVSDYVRNHPRIKVISTEGDPPERYQIEYQLRSLRRVNDELVYVKSHLVEIMLPGHYPRLPPQCRMLTPIFHPNIAPHAICIGDHWSAGEPLWSLVARIGEMIAYQSYNTKSPLNGEAARWVVDHVDELPLDPVSLLVEEERSSRAESSNEHEVEPDPEIPVLVVPEELVFTCPLCQAQLKIPTSHAGKRLRCPRCQGIVNGPAMV